ncbi:MAG TPA: CHAD domain-containing protein [Blastocatellia bacterium]|nr:CHAD domain-containing protein [Blastocatellia bacterium]
METLAQTLQIDTESPVAAGEPASDPAASDEAQAAPNPPLAPAPAVPQPRSLAEIIAHQLKSLERYHGAVLESEDPEAVHKMRVTTRRLQASLDLLQSGSQEFKIRALKKRLRRWRRRLSLVRNYDVFLLMVDAEASGRSTHREHFELLKAELQKRRVRQSLKVDKYLQRISTWSIGARLGMAPHAKFVPTAYNHPDTDAPAIESAEAAAAAEWLEVRQDAVAAEALQPEPETAAVQPGAVAGPVPFGAVSQFVGLASAEPSPPALLADERKVAGRAADRLDQRLAEFRAMAADAQPSTDPAELHQLRIAAKRLRYLMEAVCHLGYGDASRAIGWLRTLQDNLGDWHDIDAFEDEVIGIICRPGFVKANLAETGGMLQATARLMRKKEALIKRIFPVKPPALLGRTSTRLSRALRRRASLGTPN